MAPDNREQVTGKTRGLHEDEVGREGGRQRVKVLNWPVGIESHIMGPESLYQGKAPALHTVPKVQHYGVTLEHKTKNSP